MGWSRRWTNKVTSPLFCFLSVLLKWSWHQMHCSSWVLLASCVLWAVKGKKQRRKGHPKLIIIIIIIIPYTTQHTHRPIYWLLQTFRVIQTSALYLSPASLTKAAFDAAVFPLLKAYWIVSSTREGGSRISMRMASSLLHIIMVFHKDSDILGLMHEHLHINVKDVFICFESNSCWS